MLNFGMPGRDMPEFEERMKVIGQEANYGPEQYFIQVLDVLVEFWEPAIYSRLLLKQSKPKTM